MQRITDLLVHDHHRGQLLLLGRPVRSEADLLNLPSDEFMALTTHFGVGFDQLCDAFGLEIV